MSSATQSAPAAAPLASEAQALLQARALLEDDPRGALERIELQE